ncbi:kinase-like domain-containing protein [Neurospora tetraspora]|uniref:non-specific serine/threonine protein kinase n=1 Tax=Neurospora tetraspora TaxID=94610 RepID=A0AAE0IZZ5_9PEZI|nr:kinase-like domain-containing protein [Neurospora tetraspora]
MSLPDGQPPAHAGDDEGEFLYDVEDDFWGCAEPLENYKPGGLHPIILGDRLGDNGRFRVVHKLGHGGYGTVWLCQDTLSPTPKWRAVKVMSAKESKLDCAELRAMGAFRGIDLSTIENDLHISVPLDYFWINGPNGRHLALVFTLSAITANYMFSICGQSRTLVKDLCFQLFIHSRGLCHGDFRPPNILVRLCHGVDSLPEETLLKSFRNGEKPETGRVFSIKDGKPITRASAPSVPEQLVGSTSIGFYSGLCAASLAVTDFGVAARALLGPASDIWALGCCIMNLALGFTPFAHEDEGDDGNMHAAKMESLMGPMPEPFRAAYKEEHKRQPNNDGELKPITEMPSICPEYIQLRVDNEEADQLFDLLMSIFKWHPKDRATIQQVLDHPWFEERNQNAAVGPQRVSTKRNMVDDVVKGFKSYLNAGSAGSLLSGSFS